MVKSEIFSRRIVNLKIDIDLDNCTKCKACIDACPVRLFYFDTDNLNVLNNFENLCIECGHCVAVCPVNVIQLQYHKGESLRELNKMQDIPSYDSIVSIALARRSVRKFKNKPIPKEKIEKILEVARYSPTATNSEGLYFTIIQNKEVVSKISKHITRKIANFVQILENPNRHAELRKVMTEKEIKEELEGLANTKSALKTAEEGKDIWCWDAELIIIHCNKDMGWIPDNCSLAAAHIMLVAETLGLATCSLGIFTYFSNQSETIKRLINLPENHQVGYSLSIGYPDIKYKRIPARKPLKVNWL